MRTPVQWLNVSKNKRRQAQLSDSPNSFNPTPSSQQQIAIARARFEGPLPPPAMLAQYNQVFPGCAERIVQMAESQSEHRQYLEKTVVEGGVKAERRGQVFAFILGAMAIVGGIVLVALGRNVEGLVAIIGALASLATVFIWGRWRQEKERDKKRKEATSQMPLPFNASDRPD